MTAKELIRILQKYPQGMRVVVNGYETGFGEPWGWNDLEARLVSVREIRLNAGEEWGDGQHLAAEDARKKGSPFVKALVLP